MSRYAHTVGRPGQCMRWVGLALITLGLGACSSAPKGERFLQIQGEAGKGIVYIYRDSKLVGQGLEVQVLMDGVSLVRLPTGTFHATLLEPGLKRLQVKVHKAPKRIVLSGVESEQVKGYNLLDLEVKQDLKHFVQVEEGLGYILLTPRKEAEALKALDELVKAP